MTVSQIFLSKIVLDKACCETYVSSAQGDRGGWAWDSKTSILLSLHKLEGDKVSSFNKPTSVKGGQARQPLGKCQQDRGSFLGGLGYFGCCDKIA